MAATSTDIGPVTNVEAFAQARHWVRYAHRQSVVFKDRAGQWYCLRYCRGAIKRAMLAVGTSGYFLVHGQGHPALVRWGEACIRLKNAHHFSR
jgi:hypothetical protein